MEFILKRRTLSKENPNPNPNTQESSKLQLTNETLKKKLNHIKHQLELEHSLHKDQEFALAPPQLLNQTLSWQLDKWKSFDERIKILETLDFDPYSFQDVELLQLSYDMFQRFDLIQYFNIPSIILQNFLQVLRNSYRKVPFHNFYHAFNVAQSLFFFLTVCKIEEKFSKLELFALLTSAFCHDIDHPGTNNAFQVNARTKLALQFNDVSVLENHHCSQAFKILGIPDYNIFINLSSEDKILIRKYITSSILATDLAEHGNWVGKLKSKLQNINWTEFDDKKIIMCCLIKCADISNEIRPSKIGRSWAQRVMTEFYAQSLIEKEKDLPRAPHMDPEKTDLATGQIGFITYLCFPFFSLVADVFPTMKMCCDQMESNKKEWELIKENRN